MTLPEAKRRKQQSEKDRAIERARRDLHLHDEAVLKPCVAASRAPKPSSDNVVGVGHNRGPPLTADDLKVLSFKEWCRLCGFSLATGRRIINAGIGPVITQLSARRIGVTVANHLAWQASRARGAT
jgi:hypothetical protein